VKTKPYHISSFQLRPSVRTFINKPFKPH